MRLLYEVRHSAAMWHISGKSQIGRNRVVPKKASPMAVLLDRLRLCLSTQLSGTKHKMSQCHISCRNSGQALPSSYKQPTLISMYIEIKLELRCQINVCWKQSLYHRRAHQNPFVFIKLMYHNKNICTGFRLTGLGGCNKADSWSQTWSEHVYLFEWGGNRLCAVVSRNTG